MKRSGFLPVFFTALAVVFGVAVWVRLSAYQIEDQVTPAAAAQPSARETQAGAAKIDAPAETGTIVDLSSTSATSAASERQRRYDELLRNPPPAPPVAPTPPKESFLDRVVSPIAEALGMNRAKPASANAAPPKPPQPAPQQQQQRQQESRSEEASADQQAEKPKEDQDPETDVTPPQLMGAEFVPAQVQDNGETMLAAYVTDNLSGVRSVSGVISSPSGALQGFACQREGDGDRFVARIKVPPDAAEGEWSVKYLTLSDNANNSVNINQASGQLPMSAKFRVSSSASDSAPPLLRSVVLER
ncbi:MAG TPA: hypothetical protein VFP80_12160, partial [Thermoanaerobaculia bacterium]|nr:hypothetical protein [Thermoanaerobaculia bacterium]